MKNTMASITCSVCFESKQITKTPTANCKHVADTCNNCLTEYLNEYITGGSGRRDGSTLARILCIDPKCNSAFEYQDLKRILPPQHFNRWDSLTATAFLQSLPEFRWCAHSCGAGQLVEGGADVNSFFVCPKCKKLSCVMHRVPMHEGKSCFEYDKELASEGEKSTEGWKQQNTKPCPKCSAPIEKGDGCDHMTCRASGCTFEFCWSCLADFAPIRKDGNHFHKETCRFYFPIEPIP